MASINPLPATFNILVAFNNNALDDPGLITTVASPQGTLGGVNVWTDISRQVTSFQFGRGKQHENDRHETGQGTVTVDNSDGMFNPWNTSSPYTGKLNVMRPFRITGTPPGGSTFNMFTGHVKAITPQWPDNWSQTLQLSFVDAFGWLAKVKLASSTGSNYSAQVITDGATAYYRMDGPTGAIFIVDANNRGPFAACVPGANGTVTFGQDAGPALLTRYTAANFGSYNAAGGMGYIDLSGQGFSGGGSWSVEAWVNSTAGGLVVGQNTLASSNAWWIGMGPETTARVNSNSGQSFLLHSPISATGPVNPYLSIMDGAWHQIVLTFNGSTNLASMYIDTQIAGATGGPGAGAQTITGGLNLSPTTRMLVGASTGPADANGGFKLGHLSFYNGVVLSPTQISNHYQLMVGFTQAQSGTQIGAVLNQVGWAAGARNIDAGSTVIVQNSQNLASTQALAYLQQVEQTEDGDVFMDVAGKVRWIARQSLLAAPYTTVQVTFGDNAAGGELPFEKGAQLARDDLDLWNDVTVQRINGPTQQVTNAASVTSYGPNTFPVSAALHVDDVDTLAHAQWLLTHFNQPLDRLRDLVVRPVSHASLPAAVLGRELLDRITVNRHILSGGGTGFTQTALIEHITHSVDFKTSEWQVHFGLAPVDAIGGWWILGTGALDSTAVLAW
jgi:hypothetical protein